MLFMSIIGGYLYLFVLLLIPFFGFFFATDGAIQLNNYQIANIYASVVVGIGIVGLVDFLTLGMLLKRFKWLAVIYYPLYRFISVLTLSKLYRPIYYSIVTNFGKWKIGVFLVFFVIISIWGIASIANSDVPGDELSRVEFYANTQGTNAFSGSYNDQNDDIYSIRAQIPSDVISNNTLRLFVIADINIEDSIKKHCDYEKLLEESDTLSAVVKLQCLQEFFEIYINDSLVSNYEWRFHYQQKTKQRGYLTWIDISNLPTGLYELKVATPEGMSYYPRTRLPFYREENPYYQPAPTTGTGDENTKQLKSTKPFTIN
jgi:hypothetical protein